MKRDLPHLQSQAKQCEWFRRHSYQHWHQRVPQDWGIPHEKVFAFQLAISVADNLSYTTIRSSVEVTLTFTACTNLILNLLVGTQCSFKNPALGIKAAVNARSRCMYRMMPVSCTFGQKRRKVCSLKMFPQVDSALSIVCYIICGIANHHLPIMGFC